VTYLKVPQAGFLLSTMQNHKNNVTIGDTILEENYMADEQQRDIRTRVNITSEEEARRRRLEALRDKGINPYPNRVERTHTIAEVLQHFDAWRG